MNLKSYIRSIPNFPKPGILFYDISTLLANPEAWQIAISRLTRIVSLHQPEILIGIESRGFLVASPIACRLGVGFAMIRKKGKLPGQVVSHEYDLEYGSDTIQIQSDAIKPRQRVVILDDILATGGTLAASTKLIEKVGSLPVAAAGLIELTFLNGRQRNQDLPFEALITFDE